MIPPRQLYRRHADVGQRNAGVHADDTERTSQPRKVLFHSKQASVKRAQLLRDGHPLHKARVVNRQHGGRLWDKLTIQKRFRLGERAMFEFPCGATL